MAQLRITLKTGRDDLRSGSWADLVVKLRNEAKPIEVRQFTGTGGLGNHTTRHFDVDIPQLTEPKQIEFFQIRHVSQEGFAQTADNWNGSATVDLLPSPPAATRLATSPEHRFDGANRVLTLFVVGEKG